MKLSTYELRILEASAYLREEESEDRFCDSCRSDLHGGQLVYSNGFDDFHTACLVRRREVHSLHYVLKGGTR